MFGYEIILFCDNNLVLVAENLLSKEAKVPVSRPREQPGDVDPLGVQVRVLGIKY